MHDEHLRCAATWSSSPWWDEGMLPANWLLANMGKFLHSPAYVVANSEEWTPEWGFPEISGNYFLIQEGDIVYTGVSSFIAQRISQHVENGKVFTHVWAFHGLPRLLAEAMETFYIHALNPKLNTKKPRLWPDLRALYEHAPWAAEPLSA